MEGGHRLQGHQVVGVGRPVRLPPRRVEDVHGGGQTDTGADGPEGRRRWRRPSPDHGVEVVGVGRSLGTSRPDSRPASRRMSVTEVERLLVSMSTTIGAIPRDGRRMVSRMSSRRMWSGSEPIRR